MSAPAAPTPSSAASPDSGVLFRERLLPGVGMWTVLVLFGALCGVIFVPFSVWTSIVVASIMIPIMIVVGAVTSPVVEVRGTTLRLGRAEIDVSYLGEVIELTGDSWEEAMSTGFEPLAHHQTRGWIPSGVRAEVVDEDDPVVAWVTSSRRPEDLALALRSARATPQP